MNVAAIPAALSGVFVAEWQVRCDLAALYRLNGGGGKARLMREKG